MQYYTAVIFYTRANRKLKLLPMVRVFIREKQRFLLTYIGERPTRTLFIFSLLQTYNMDNFTFIIIKFTIKMNLPFIQFKGKNIIQGMSEDFIR